MRRLRRDEAGFSLIELMAAMAIGGIVLTAVMTIFINGLRGATEVQDRVDAQQRGRLAMDRATTLLSSQVCLSSATPPIAPGSTANDVTFYGDLNGASDTPTKYELIYDPVAHTLTEKSWTGIGKLPAAVTFAAAPTKTNQVATDVYPDGANPIFSFYRFEADGTINLNTPIALTGAGSSLAATDADDIVEVGVRFRIAPSRKAQSDPRSTTITGQALAGSANPASPSAGPNCR
jgi:prepilin-type N-terminal cleavage/methylation domain-containing protein